MRMTNPSIPRKTPKPCMRPRGIDPEISRIIFTLSQQNYGTRQIANEFGLSRNTIRRILWEKNRQFQKGLEERKTHDSIREQVAELIIQGLAPTWIFLPSSQENEAILVQHICRIRTEHPP